MNGWFVRINGKDTGIIETNYRYAVSYWAERARITARKIELVPVCRENAQLNKETDCEDQDSCHHCG